MSTTRPILPYGGKWISVRRSSAVEVAAALVGGGRRRGLPGHAARRWREAALPVVVERPPVHAAVLARPVAAGRQRADGEAARPAGQQADQERDHRPGTDAPQPGEPLLLLFLLLVLLLGGSVLVGHGSRFGGPPVRGLCPGPASAQHTARWATSQ